MNRYAWVGSRRSRPRTRRVIPQTHSTLRAHKRMNCADHSACGSTNEKSSTGTDQNSVSKATKKIRRRTIRRYQRGKSISCCSEEKWKHYSFPSYISSTRLIFLHFL